MSVPPSRTLTTLGIALALAATPSAALANTTGNTTGNASGNTPAPITPIVVPLEQGASSATMTVTSAATLLADDPFTVHLAGLDPNATYLLASEFGPADYPGKHLEQYSDGIPLVTVRAGTDGTATVHLTADARLSGENTRLLLFSMDTVRAAARSYGLPAPGDTDPQTPHLVYRLMGQGLQIPYSTVLATAVVPTDFTSWFLLTSQDLGEPRVYETGNLSAEGTYLIVEEYAGADDTFHTTIIELSQQTLAEGTMHGGGTRLAPAAQYGTYDVYLYWLPRPLGDDDDLVSALDDEAYLISGPYADRPTDPTGKLPDLPIEFWLVAANDESNPEELPEAFTSLPRWMEKDTEVGTTDVFSGDWDGDGTDTPGFRIGNIFWFAHTNSPTTRWSSVDFGRPQDTVFVGDWDGNGTDTLALRRGNIMYLKNSISSGNADVSFAYGRTTDQAVVGDWDQDGADSIGVRRANVFHLRNDFVGGKATTEFAYGRATDRVFIGDWDGDGVDTPTVGRLGVKNELHVSNRFRGGPSEYVLPFDGPGSITVTGDWNGDGTDTFMTLYTVDF